MGLKARLYLYLTSVLLTFAVVLFFAISLFSRNYVELTVEQALTELSALIEHDVVIANRTNNFVALQARLQSFVDTRHVAQISWDIDGRDMIHAYHRETSATSTVPTWFYATLAPKEVVLVQPVTWDGATYGTLHLYGDASLVISNQWHFVQLLMLFLMLLAAVAVVSIELLTKPIIQQIRTLLSDTERIGKGFLDAKIHVGGSAEVLRLSLAMENMRSTLYKNHEESEKQHRQLRELGQENERHLIWFRNLFNTLPQAVLLTDSSEQVVFTNQNYCDFFHIQQLPHQLTGRDSLDIIDRIKFLFSDVPLFDQARQASLSAERQMTQHLLLMDDGRYLVQRIIPTYDRRLGQFFGRLWLYEDVTKERAQEERLHWQATHDTLTGLHNRTALEQQLASLQHAKQTYALLYLDLDQFRLVNDTSGHAAGDELIRQIGHKLHHLLPADTFIARMGGDEFAIITPSTANQAMKVADSVLFMVRRFRFVYLERHYHIAVSIGVVPDINLASDTKMLMAMADAACYAAKNAGGNTAWLYHNSDEYLRQQHEEMRVVSDLHAALEGDQFELFAQKLVPLQYQSPLLHIEILLRWQNDQGRFVPPDVFIPAAERYGLMHKIDRWVIEKALTFLSAHPHLLNHIMVLGINLSGASLSQPDLVDYVRDLIRRLSFPAEKIYFEITETSAVAQLDQAHAFIVAMKALGCQFALDDFGAGQSSFRYLKQLPVDYLKIDGSFIQTMLQDKTNAALVRGMQEIAQSLGMKTVAEFVENKDIADELTRISVDYAQGWFFHKAQSLISLSQSVADMPASDGSSLAVSDAQ